MKRSPTDTLVAAMEEAEKAAECLVIMTTTDGDIIYLCSTDAKSTKFGLLEMTKQCIVADMRTEER